MVDANDVQGYRDKFDGQIDRLESADIDDRDREAINRFIVHCRTNDTDIGSLGTVIGHCNRLRLAAERSRHALVEFGDVAEVNAFKLRLEDDHGLSQGTIRNYTKALRKFFVWQDRDWADEISVGAPPDRTHDPDEEISADELDALLGAATNPRDKALVAILADTGLRVGAVLSLQMRHVDFEGRQATLSINEEANIKGDGGPKPVTWSRGYVANWIDVHPRPETSNAALIHKLRDWDKDDDAALSQQYAGRIISDIAERAGLDTDRIEPRLFRATSISRWIREDMGEQAIKHRTGWSKDSRMFDTYSRVTDEEMNSVVFEHYGIADPDDADPEPSLTECPQCRTTLRGTETFCPGCGSPMTPEATETAREQDQTIMRATANESGERAEALADLAALLDEHPTLREAIGE